MKADVLLLSLMNGSGAAEYTVQFVTDSSDPASGGLNVSVPYGQTESQQATTIKQGVVDYINGLVGAGTISVNDVRLV
jgi:hypothetical protein